MNSTRQSLTTTLLNNGQVLVAAGMDYYADVLNSAELYEPATQAPPGLVSVAVGPANSVISVGTAQLLSAVGTFSDDSTQTLGSLTWTSSDSTIAAISNDASNHGNALGVAPGLVTMNACAGSVCGSTTITVVSPPSITGISPTSGFIGTTLTITGTNFGTNQGTSTVTFNGTVAAEILNWGATSIVAMVPAGATTGSVAVSANAASSTGPTFTISSAGSFGITSIFPSSGVPGMQVQINGGGFGTSQGSSTISLNGTNAVVTNWTDANIVAIVPSGATSGPFSVTVGGQTVHSSPFTVTSLPSGWLDADVGAVGVAGSSSYTTGTFSVSGAGSQISGSVDAFHFVYQTLSGDGSIVARVRIPSGTQAGVMVRQSLDAGSPFGTTLAYGTHVEFDARAVEDGSTSQPGEVFNLSSPFWVELVRSGSTLTSYRSSDGVNWTVVGSATLNMTPNVYVGLVVDSGSTSSTATATFDNVSVNSTVMPAPVITSVSATTGSVGSQVVISGSNFGASQGSSVVTLNAMPVTINSWSDSSMSITIPAGATSGLLVVSAAPSMNDSNPVVFTVTAQPLPSGWLDVDVGAVGVAGSSSYTTGTFSVSGAGSQISGSVDAFHFVYQTLSGDGSIVARVRIPSGTQAGVMVRQSLDAGSPFGTTLAYGTHVEFDARAVEDGSTSQPGEVFNLSSPFWVELVRSGSTLTSYRSSDGVNWTVVGSATLNMTPNVYVGLVVDSGSTSSTATATFDNVSVNSTVMPAPVITSVSATTGSVGSQVVISGSNFGASQGSSVVTLNAMPVTINSWSDSSISITIPAGATSGLLVVSAAPSMNDSNPVVFTVTAQPLPSGWLDVDVGAVGVAGSSSYTTGTFSVSGAGSQISGSVDAFHFVYQTLSGDGSIVARVRIPSGTQAGVMVRQSLDAGSPFGTTLAYGTHVEFDARAVEDGSTSQPGEVFNLSSPFWVELVRSGSTLTSYRSSDGVNWTVVGSATLNMTPNVYVGLVVDSGSTSSTATATFDNVSVSFSQPIAAPSITSLSPDIAAQGSSVIITGANFGSLQGANSVTFNGTVGMPTYWGSTTIDVPVPVGATSGSVVITVGGVPSNGMPLTVSQAPIATSLFPSSGPAATSVTITGLNFGSSQASSSVTFNGTAATPTNWSPTSIVVPVPAGATTGNVIVTVAGVASNAIPFTVFPQPTISRLSTTSTTIGASLTITGTNFGSTQGTSTLTFNGVGGTPVSWNSTSIVTAVPIGATTGNVVVTVNGVASNPASLTVGMVSLPPVSQVQPSNGSTGFPENGRIIVRFAQPVQSSAIVSGAVVLSEGPNNIGGTLALSNDGLSVTFTPFINLAANSTFTVTVTDVAGNQTMPEFQSSFVTGSSTDTRAPVIIQTSPQNDNTGVPISAPIVMQFSKPMNPATLTPQSFTVTDPVSGAVPGTVQVDPTGTTASFVPQGYLSVGRTIGVGLNQSSIQDSSGNDLQGSNASFSFTTSFTPDTTAPQMLGSDPPSAATGVPLNALIVLQFSKPLDVISVSNGLQVEAGGQAIPGAIAASNSNQQVTFTPIGGLAANTTYTVVTSSQIIDVGGLALANPGSFSLTTGSVSDSTTPSVVSASPSNSQTEVPTNAVIQLHFSKAIDPWTVTSSTFFLTYGSNGVVAGTSSVSTDGLTATFTPSGPLAAYTSYNVQATSGITDLEGHGLGGYGFSFTTGSGTDSSAPTVLTVSPANSATSVPVNVRVDLMMSAELSAASIGPNAVVVSSNGLSVPGTVTLNSNGTILTYLPANSLASNSTYTVSASGFTDEAGNAVVPFTSIFTTSASGSANTTTPAVTGVSPVNGATSVSVGSPIVLTFNEAVDATTLSDTTLPISVGGAVLAGTYSLDSSGAVVTFTPLSPLPGNATVTVQVNSGVLDLSGNASASFYSTFTTGAGTDTTPPTVAMVSPQNGASGIGTNLVAVLTFSKSLNPSTINTNDLALLANGSPLAVAISVSADNRTVMLKGYGVPVSSTISILATSGITDLSGNALVNFQSQFTTAGNAAAPSVVSQLPGNGATGVPLNASLVIYMSEAMNASSLQGALEVSQNGALVSGTIRVTNNGQVIQFIPSSQWQPGALVQIFLTSAAQSVSGLNVNNYQASFTTGSDASTTAPTLVATNPVTQVINVPTNVVIDFAFNEPLDPTALLPDTVDCSQNGVWFQTGVSVINGGTVLQVTPRLPLAANTVTNCMLGNGIQGTNGLALSYLSANSMSFTTGAGPDRGVPLILTTSPPNGSANVGDNGSVNLVFSKPMNPLSLSSSSVQLSSGGETLTTGSVSFSNNNQSVTLVPSTPLPDGTQMTLTISGVTDVAGNLAGAQTTQFTTGSGPDVVPPMIMSTSPFQGAQNVPLNTVITLQMSQAIDPGTVNSSTLTLVNGCNGQTVTGTYSVSTDGLTITFVPAGSLSASCGYSVNFPGAGFGVGISDLAGNSLQGTPSVNFTTGMTTSTSAPQVLGVSPANGMTAVPINAQVVIEFNEPVDGTTLSGVTLTGVTNLTQNLTNGNQRLSLIPTVPLSASTSYTLTVSGVQDLSGNTMSAPFTASFSTGTTADLTPAQVVSETPASNATGVSTSTTASVTFSKVVDPLTLSSSTMQLVATSTGIPVSGAVSSNGSSASFTPNEPLDSLTRYLISLTNGVTDMEGQSLYGGSFSSYFTTGQGSPAQAPTIVSIPGGGAAPVGQSITLQGTYFGTAQNGSTLTFNGVAGTPTNWTDTTISVPVPSGATSGPIVVTVNGLASNNFEFTVLQQPTVTGISPNSGAAGAVVTITGTNLGDTRDSIQVDFNGIVVPPSNANETSITVTVPITAPAGTYTPSVNVNGYYGSGPSFTVVPTPVISGLDPNSGVTGTPVGISGNNFGSSQGSSTVTFNGVPAASITSWSSAGITAIPPSNVTTGPVVVVVNSVPSVSTNNIFTVTNPALGSISPPAAAPGAIVTLYGSGFEPQGQQTWQVLFNGVPSQSIGCTAYYCSIENPPYSSLTAEVPSGATSGPVTVVIGGVASNSLNFTVEAQPTITSLSPTIGPMDSNGNVVPITITGTGFGATQSTSTVNFFGSSTAPNIISWSDTSISLNVPSDAGTGPLYITVGGVSALAPSFFTINSVTQLTDSLGNPSQYNVASQGGSWFATSSQGTGCSSCSMRGNISQTPDANGNVLTSTDDQGNVTSYTYDPNSNVASISKPLNGATTATSSYTYNSFGEVLTSTDPLGNTTTNTYDAHGNLLTVTSPAPNGSTPASVTQFQYATNGELTQITDPKGNVTKLTYTPVGLIASITDTQNNTTSYQYDSMGDRTAVIDPVNGSNHPTSFTYDAMSRLTGITYPDGSTASFTYDIRGRRITATDQNGKTTTYTYDDADRLTAVTDPANHTTQYNYDTEDNLLSITDANGHTTQFAYNARGWVTQTTFPSSLTESYNYDLVGNLLSKTDRKGNTIQYVYDALYRLTSKTYPDSTGVEYAYDLAGKVLQVSDPTGSYGFAYDNMGRLIGTSTQYSFLSGTYANAYTYDAASNRTSLTAPDGSITTYGYDTLNRLNGLASSWAGSFGFSYDALSRRTSLTRPNGITTSYAYDSVSHLLSVLHKAGANTLDGASYTYDPAGNRTAKANYLNGITSNYSYDPIYELTQVTQGGSTTESYTYDPVGNRLSSSGVPNYNYNVSNELTSDSSGGFTYDANGNTLTDSSGKSYTWDFENRLMQAVVPGTNGGTTTFKYDPFGRRIEKISPTAASIFVYDGVNLIETVNGSGGEVASYTQMQNIDETLAELRGSTTDYYQPDGLGSITSLSGSSGTLANTYTYDSFGNLTTSAGTVRNYFQYTGREFDPETGIYEYRARYYDPVSGRFISEDPTRFRTGINFYKYASNDPLLFRDPSGLDCSCTYSISTGHFHCSGLSTSGGPISFDSSGYSGLPEYQNDPALTFLWGGPIPMGTYTISPGYKGTRGNPQFNLTPAPGIIPPGRDPNSFLVHADNPSHPGWSSEGCIVLPLNGRQQLDRCGSGTLSVTQ